jgi:hypothetical protein
MPKDLMLFMLGRVFEKSQKRFASSPVELRLSKVGFIKAMMKINAVKIKERAIYKNLEALEKMKLIKYENKDMQLTKKGIIRYKKVFKKIGPYLETEEIIKSTRIPVRKTKLRIQ